MPAKDFKMYITQKPHIGKQVYIAKNATVYGAVSLGDDVSIWPGVVIRGDVNTITVGDRTNIQDNTVLHTTHASEYFATGFPLTIGCDVTIGHNATLHGCTIKDRVLVGMGAIVMDGAVIESDTLLAAGALVTPNKHLESGFLYRGNPAVKARALTDKEKDFLLYSAKNYIHLKNEHVSIQPIK